MSTKDGGILKAASWGVHVVVLLYPPVIEPIWKCFVFYVFIQLIFSIIDPL